ncbi:MAG: hypothetical protein ACLPSF_06450 [Methylocella sp.]
MIHKWRYAGRLAAAIASGAIFCGLAAGAARAGDLAGDLTAPPADLMIAAPDAAAVAVPKPTRPVAKAARKAKAAAREAVPARAVESTPPAPDKPAEASKPSTSADGPVSLVGKWNGENETDYGAATALRGINQSIDSKLLGGSTQPVGAGAEVGVKYKF